MFTSEMKDFILNFEGTVLCKFFKTLSRSVKEKIKRIEQEIQDIENMDSLLIDMYRKSDLEN